MSNIFSRIFGTGDVIEKAAGGVVAGVDASFFTKEERARHFLELLTRYEPFKLAQRLLAMIVGIPYVLTWLVCVALFVGSVVADPCTADAVCKSTQLQDASQELATLNNDTLGVPFSIILAFYFGGGAVEGVMRARKSAT